MKVSPSQILASKLLAKLVAAGVRDFLLAPGSRSQALAVAVSQLEQLDNCRVTVRIDERGLGFLGVGLAKATNRAVALITTSGSAVANLHPAVLEASHSGVPLILLTADRPHELRGVGANQTTNQIGLFADAVRHCFDVPAPNTAEDAEQVARIADKALAIATGRGGERPGPVQLNLAFREPLSSSMPNAFDEYRALNQNQQLELASVPEAVVATTPSHSIETKNLGCVIAGSNAGPRAARFAEAASWPLFAEPISGARAGSSVIERYADLLSEGIFGPPNSPSAELVSRIRQVVVFGRPTLNKVLIDLMARDSISISVVRDGLHGTYDPTRRAERFVDHIAAIGRANSEWLDSWRAANVNLASSLHDESRKGLVASVFNATKEDGSALLLGASDLIRQADRWFSDCSGIDVFANRGVAGIDGTISTAIGTALSNNYPRVRVLLGDVTFAHDVASLNTNGLPDFNLQLVIGNDSGGRIFEKLKIRNSVREEHFERLFLTPQHLNFEAISKAFGWNYVAPENELELDSALRANGLQIIDFRLPAV